jgi:hypothetical protein
VATGGAVPGLAGMLVAAVATSEKANPGPAELLLLDEPAAKTALAELQLAE